MRDTLTLESSCINGFYYYDEIVDVDDDVVEPVSEVQFRRILEDFV